MIFLILLLLVQHLYIFTMVLQFVHGLDILLVSVTQPSTPYNTKWLVTNSIACCGIALLPSSLCRSWRPWYRVVQISWKSDLEVIAIKTYGKINCLLGLILLDCYQELSLCFAPLWHQEWSNNSNMLTAAYIGQTFMLLTLISCINLAEVDTSMSHNSWIPSW